MRKRSSFSKVLNRRHIVLALASVLATGVVGMGTANAAPKHAQHHASEQDKHNAGSQQHNSKSGKHSNAAPSRHSTHKAPPTRRIQESRPRRPNARAVWIDGYWSWTGNRHQWVRGHWDANPRGKWAAASWQKKAGLWIFIPGRWR